MKTLLAALLFSFVCGSAQTGMMFPPLSGQDLSHHQRKVPFKNGKYSVVGIAFSRSAEPLLKEWLNPVYNTFIVKEGEDEGFDMAKLLDVNFIFVPMVSGFGKAASEFKKGTDKEFWPYILNAENENISDAEKTLEIKDKSIPYFYVLDKEGKVVAVQSGKYSDDKLEKLIDAIE